MMNADNSHTDTFYTRLQCIKEREYIRKLQQNGVKRIPTIVHDHR